MLWKNLDIFSELSSDVIPPFKDANSHIPRIIKLRSIVIIISAAALLLPPCIRYTMQYIIIPIAIIPAYPK